MASLSFSASTQGPVAELRMVAVDTSQFPSVTVQAAPILKDGTVPQGLDPAGFRVYEDGAPRPVVSVTPAEVPAQVAVLLYAAPTSLSAGATGRTQKDEAIEAIDELILTGRWIDTNTRVDQVMLIMPKGATGYNVYPTWTNNYPIIHNAAYTFTYGSQLAYSPLYPMLLEAIRRMEDLPNSQTRAKFILLFSDGRNIRSVEQARDVINEARAKNVTILSITLGPPKTWQAADIDRMAEETGGAHVGYNGIEAARNLYQVIRSQRQQYVIGYRSGIGQTGMHGVELGLDLDGTMVRSLAVHVPLTVKPPEVKITYPATGVQYIRATDKVGANTEEIEPRQDRLEIQVSWPDQHPREIVQLRYVVDGVTSDPLPVGPTMVWDFSRIVSGTHSVYVTVRDELGLEGRSDPITAVIRIDRPVPPPPPDWLTIAALVVGVLALALAVWVAIFRPKAVQAVAQAVVKTIEKTVPGLKRRTAKDIPFAKAYLVAIPADGTPGVRYPITRFPAILGRDQTKSDILLPDQTISGCHASLQQEAQGVFVLRDEGGRNGTYLNGQEVPGGAGIQIRNGDRVELGDAAFTFEVVSSEGGAKDPTEASIAGGRRKQ